MRKEQLYDMKVAFLFPYEAKAADGDRVLYDRITIEEAKQKMLEYYNSRFISIHECPVDTWERAVELTSMSGDNEGAFGEGEDMRIHWSARTYGLVKSEHLNDE